MTIDDRLDAAAAELAAPTGTVDRADEFVRFRQRRRLASVSGLAAVLLVVAGLVAVALPSDHGTSQVSAQSREQLARDLETRLLVEGDIGAGWHTANLDATPAPSDTCGIAQVESRFTPIATAHREFASASLAVIGERISGYHDQDEADGVITALRRAFEGCTSFKTDNPEGGSTEGVLHPLALDIPGSSTFAMSGDLTMTDAKGVRGTATAFWVAVAHRNLVSIIFGVDFTDTPTNNAAIAHIATQAAARLSTDG